MQNNNIKILHLEDHESDANLIHRLLKQNGIKFDMLLVDNRQDYINAITEFCPDLIISDHNLPSFNSIEALNILKTKKYKVPFILVTGTLSVDFAVEAMKAGADDCIIKDKLHRLPVAVLSSLDKHKVLKKYEAAQLSIKESNAKYLSFFENSMDAILLTVTDGEIIAANTAACKMFQMTQPEILEVGRFGMVDLHDPRVMHLIKKRQQTGYARGELTFKRKNGEKFPGEITASKFINGRGQERTSMIIRDISKRKVAEEKNTATSKALQQAIKELTKVMDLSLDMICSVDEVGKFKQVSAASQNILGYAPSELMGKPIFDYVYPEDLERTIATSEQVMLGKTLTNFENRYVHKDGSLVTLAWSTNWDENERIRHGVARDVTEKNKAVEKIKESDLLLRNIDANSLDVICTINQNGEFIYVSSASYTVWGYKPSELIGKKMMGFVYKEDRELTEKIDASILSGQSITMFENRFIRKDGSIVSILWSSRWEKTDQVMYCVAKDATELRKAENTIIMERKRLSDLFMFSPVSMCIVTGEELTFELANPLYLMRMEKKNILGKTVKEVFPEFKNNKKLERLEIIFRSGETMTLNETLRTINEEGNFTEVYLNQHYQPYRDEEGKVAGIFYFGIDVTEQVRWRKQIEEAEQRYRQIVETAQEGIWVVDKNVKTTFANNKLCELLEYTREEMIGKDIYFFLDEEWKDIVSKSINRRKNGKVNNIQVKYITKSKKELWVNVSANPLYDEDNHYKGALAMLTDITSQKRTQEENKKLAKVAELTMNSVIVTNTNGKIIWVNKGFERITEFSFAEVLGKSPGIVLQGTGTDPAVVAHMRTCIKNGKGFRVDILNYTKAGCQYWVDMEVVPLHDENHVLAGFMSIEQDITDRKKSERETINLINTLQKKNQDLQQFSYIVSHNLRAPIAKLMGLASIIEVEEGENKFLIDQVAIEANHLDEVVQDINMIVSARKLEKEIMDEFDLKSEIQNVLQVLETQILETDATIVYDLSEVTSLFTIKSYLYSIIYNLLSNALKYRQPNLKPKIFIRSSIVESNICLSVKDNGMGIDLDKHESKIFGLYKRFHGNTIPGKGVGLHLVKTHAETLGGFVVVTSSINVGTEFKIYLPKNYETIENS